MDTLTLKATTTSYDIAAVVMVPVTLFYIAKVLWRVYLLRTARDPSTDLLHLPIPPGDFGLPFIGETLTWAMQGSDFNIIRRKKYGNIYSSNYIGKTVVKVTGPEYVKQILTASQDKVQTVWPTSVQKVIGASSIANSIGEVHKYRRKIFLKAFTHSALKSYVQRSHRTIRNRLEKWLDSDETIFVYPSTRKITFEVAFQLLVGLEFKDEEEKQQLFETFDSMVMNLFSLPVEFPGSSFSKAMKAKNKIHSLLDDHLKTKWNKVRQHVENNEFAATSTDESLQNAMHYVLEAIISDETTKQNGRLDQEETDLPQVKETLSDVELKETTIEMLFAGYQTTASSLTSAIINLIKHPECFKKLEDELREFGLLSEEDESPCFDVSHSQNHLNSDEISKSEDINCNIKPSFTSCDVDMTTCKEDKEISFELLAKLPYLEQVMRETLRINPPILGGYRQAKKTFQIGKYRIPKGWNIIYNIRDTHEAEWEDDREFNPDRFNGGNMVDNKESRFRWIPFGGGPRICVGKEFARMQFKLFLIEIVRKFSKIEFLDGKPPKMFAIPMLHPTNNLPVVLTPRYQRKKQIETKKYK